MLWYNDIVNNLKAIYIPALGRTLDVSSVRVEGIDMSDAFRFRDAFVSKAVWLDAAHKRGSYNLGQDELNIIMENEEVQMLVNQIACDSWQPGFTHLSCRIRASMP